MVKRDIMGYIEVANANEIPIGTTKYIEVENVEILLVNVEGKYFAISNRCGHQNAPLSNGDFEGNIVTCPLHHARFDVTSGKLVSVPTAHAFPGFEKAPKELQKALMDIGEMTSHIKIHNLTTYETKMQDNKIMINIK